MKHIIPAIALALAAVTFTATPAVAAAATHTAVTTVDKVLTLASSNGDTTAIETDKGTFLLPKDMTVPEAGTAIKLSYEDDSVLSWRETTVDEYREAGKSNGKLKDEGTDGTDTAAEKTASGSTSGAAAKRLLALSAIYVTAAFVVEGLLIASAERK